MPFNGSLPTPYWFNPMRLMAEAVGTDDERYVWWYGVLGNTSATQLTDLEVLAANTSITYPDMTSENINALGLKEIFRLWMFHYLWTIITD